MEYFRDEITIAKESKLKGNNVALHLVDKVFTRKFFCAVSWSGVTRKDCIAKAEFRSYRQLLVFFFRLCSAVDPSYELTQCTQLMKNTIISNCVQRYNAKLVRASRTKHRTKIVGLSFAEQRTSTKERNAESTAATETSADESTAATEMPVDESTAATETPADESTAATKTPVVELNTVEQLNLEHSYFEDLKTDDLDKLLMDVNAEIKPSDLPDNMFAENESNGKNNGSEGIASEGGSDEILLEEKNVADDGDGEDEDGSDSTNGETSNGDTRNDDEGDGVALKMDDKDSCPISVKKRSCATKRKKRSSDNAADFFRRSINLSKVRKTWTAGFAEQDRTQTETD